MVQIRLYFRPYSSSRHLFQRPPRLSAIRVDSHVAMTTYPVFLSLVLVVRNRFAELEKTISELTTIVSSLATDYEIIVVDNASNDRSVEKLKSLTAKAASQIFRYLP